MAHLVLALMHDVMRLFAALLKLAGLGLYLELS